MLGDYIASDLSQFSSDFNSLLNFTLITQAAPKFSALLTSAPTLFADLSLAIDAASSQINIPPSFDDSTNQAAVSAIGALSTGFVVRSSDACGITLSNFATEGALGLFRFVLPVFVIFQQECALLDVALIEQAVAAADIFSNNNLEVAINDAVGFLLMLSRRLFIGVRIISSSGLTPDAAVPAAAQALLDDFLFFINDFCGIPPLSSTALTQLNDYFLVDLVAHATRAGPPVG